MLAVNVLHQVVFFDTILLWHPLLFMDFNSAHLVFIVSPACPVHYAVFVSVKFIYQLILLIRVAFFWLVDFVKLLVHMINCVKLSQTFITILVVLDNHLKADQRMVSLVYFAKVVNVSLKELWDVMKDYVVFFIDLISHHHVVLRPTTSMHQSELFF